MPVVWIPALLQSLTDGAATVTVPGRTLRQVIDNLETRYPGLQARLIDPVENRLHPEIVAAIDSETTHLGLIQPLDPDSEIQFIPAVSGG